MQNLLNPREDIVSSHRTVVGFEMEKKLQEKGKGKGKVSSRREECESSSIYPGLEPGTS
jgi:hypothetical protein